MIRVKSLMEMHSTQGTFVEVSGDTLALASVRVTYDLWEAVRGDH